MDKAPLRRACLLLAVTLAVTLAGCSLPLPIDDGRVAAPRGGAPGRCAEVTEFAYVGTSTLRDLGFSDEADEFGDDFERRGRFWVTAEPMAVVDTHALEAEQQALATRARAEGQPLPPRPPQGEFDRPEQRMLCVRWTDGNPTGLVDMAIGDNWSPPSN